MNTKMFSLTAGIIVIAGMGVWLSSDSNTPTDQSAQLLDDHHADGEMVEHEIYPGDVVSKLDRGDNFVLLDVRTHQEYTEIHLKNSLLLPVQELSQKSLNDIGLGTDKKDTEIILYCRSGARSETALNIMKSLGYTNVKSVSGGMIHWQEDQYPYTATGEYAGDFWDTETMTNVTGPRIAVGRPLHDFGQIPQSGGVVETTFLVTNQGNMTLEIGDLTTSCSCTSASIEKSTLKPGESTKLHVVFDPDFHDEPLGVFKRTVFIPSNDPNTPEKTVAVQVDILEGE